MNWNKTIVSTVTWYYSISYCYIYVTVFVIVIIVVWYLESLMVWKFKIIVMVQNVLFRICKHVIGWFCFICLIQIYLKFTQCIQWGYYECEFTFHHCYHSVYGMATMSNVCKWYALFFNKEFWTCRLYVTKHTKQYAITILQLAFLWHDDVMKWQIFRVTGSMWGESTGHRWFPLTKPSDAERWRFLWSAPEQTEKTIETPVIWDPIALIMTSQW